LEKIEDGNSFLLGEVQSQKQTNNILRVSLDHVSTEMSKFTKQVVRTGKIFIPRNDKETTDRLNASEGGLAAGMGTSF
jgi:hypothetical protein